MIIMSYDGHHHQIYPLVNKKFSRFFDIPREILQTHRTIFQLKKHPSNYFFPFFRFKKLIEKVLQQMNEIGKLSKTLIDYGKFHHSFGAEQKYATVSAIDSP